jgi:hypothetical protein
MREIARVVQAVCDLIPTGGMGPADREVVATYIRWREEAANRLTAFTAALDAGDDYRALLVAEMEPRLPDFVAHLGLVAHLGRAANVGRSEDEQWAVYCRQHGLPVPPPLDPAAVQRLHSLYRQGITRSSPFYQDCLAAIAAGDEERALSLIRSIVRLAHDNDARAHLELMLRKRVTPQLAALRTCLERGDANGVLGWLNEIERSGADALLAEDGVYLAAVAARKAILSQRAAVEAGAYLDAAAAQAKLGDWPTVRAGIARIRRLESEWGLSFTPEQAARLGGLEKQAAEFQAEASKKEQFRQALVALLTFAERKHNQLLDQADLPLAELKKVQESLTDLWNQVEAFHLPIPQEESSRLHEIADLLQHRLSGRRESGRFRKAALIVPLVVVLAAATGAGYLYKKAQDQLRQLEELQDGKLGGAANRMLNTIMQSSAGWILNLSPETQAKLEKLRKWAGLELKRLHDAEKQLDEIDAFLKGPLEEMTPEALMEKLKAAKESMKDLAHDNVGPVRERLKRQEELLRPHIEALTAKNVEKVRKALGDLGKLVNDLDFEKPLPELAATLSTVQTELLNLDPFEHPAIPALALPEDLTAALRQIRAKVRPFTVEMGALAWAKDAMAKAAKLQDYKLALEQCSKLRFRECREAAAMVLACPSENETAARLFFGGDLEAWQMARQQAAKGYHFIPDEMVAEEVRRLATIRDDPNLNAPGPARKLLEAMRLREALDSAGGKITIPLIELLDRVVRLPQGDVMVKAYLARELHGIMRARSLAWGLHYAPELAASMTELDSILGPAPLRSGDWNRPDARKKWQSKLQTFFETAAKGATFRDLAGSYLELVAPAATRGVSFAGYVDETRAAHLKSQGDEPPPLVVWGLSEKHKNPVPVALPAGPDGRPDLKDLRMWSPLLIIPVDPRQAEGRLTAK